MTGHSSLDRETKLEKSTCGTFLASCLLVHSDGQSIVQSSHILFMSVMTCSVMDEKAREQKKD